MISIETTAKQVEPPPMDITEYEATITTRGVCRCSGDIGDVFDEQAKIRARRALVEEVYGDVHRLAMEGRKLANKLTGLAVRSNPQEYFDIRESERLIEILNQLSGFGLELIRE